MVGQARGNLGDPGGLAEMERAVTLMERHHHHMAGLGRYGMAWAMWWYGDLERCAAYVVSGREAVARYNPAMLRWLDAVHAGLDYVHGNWDAVLAFVEEFLGSYAQGQLRYLEPWCRTLRARVHPGRDEPDTALQDTKIALDLTEPARDTRSGDAALAVHIWALLATGARTEASCRLNTLLTEQHEHPAQACATPDLGVLLVELDYPPDALATGLTQFRWHQAVAALARHDLDQASRILEAIGAHADQAWVQLRLAEHLHDQQQPRLAGAELTRALAFAETAAATACLRRGHQLLAKLVV